MNAIGMRLAVGLAVVAAVCLVTWAGDPADADGSPAADRSDKADASAPAQAEDEAAATTETPEEPVNQVSLLKGKKLAWYHKLRTHVHGSMVGADNRRYREAEQTLLDITDRNALEPMALVLYTRNTRWRSSFLKAARQYAQSEDDFAGPLAVAYLSDIAVLDPSGILRGGARSALLSPDTPRHTDRLKVQLAANGESVCRTRAARLLADLEDDSAAGTMVEMLTTQEWRLVAKAVEARNVQMDLRMAVAHPPDLSNTTVVQAAVPGSIAEATITLPRVQVTQVHTTVSAPAGARIDYEWERVTVKHPGMLSVLKRMTGKDFRYDKDAWRAWLRAQGMPEGARSEAGGVYDVHWDD